MPKAQFFTFILLLLLIASCNRNGGRVELAADLKPFDRLSQYGFFTGNLADLQPNEGVLPYDLNSPLFSDYAEKARFIWLPNGQKASYVSSGSLQFPIGTVIIKNFYYHQDNRNPQLGRRIIETRLLIHTETGWEAWPYIWDDEQKDATMDVVGGNKQISWLDKSGESHELNYSIPNKNQCKGCHDWKGSMQPIGPQAKHLNKDFQYEEGTFNQLEYWKKIGYLQNLPSEQDLIPRMADYTQVDSPNGNLNERARAYLDINCGHCHNAKGPAKTSGLSLLYEETNPTAIGINKPPIAAGRGSGNLKFSIVPGHSEESILLYRMLSADPGSMMPEIGRKMVHEEGAELIREWIDAMEPTLRK
ncbi:SO2930 family diheme c-type cytochrome [Peijinzhouia sedimentorum]